MPVIFRQTSDFLVLNNVTEVLLMNRDSYQSQSYHVRDVVRVRRAEGIFPGVIVAVDDSRKIVDVLLPFGWKMPVPFSEVIAFPEFKKPECAIPCLYCHSPVTDSDATICLPCIAEVRNYVFLPTPTDVSQLCQGTWIQVAGSLGIISGVTGPPPKLWCTLVDGTVAVVDAASMVVLGKPTPETPPQTPRTLLEDGGDTPRSLPLFPPGRAPHPSRDSPWLEAFNILVSLLFSMILYGVTVWAAVTFSMAQGETVNVLATMCLAIFFLMWRIIRTMTKKIYNQPNCTRVPSVKQEKFLLKAVLVNALFWCCFVILLLKTLYLYNYWGDYQNPCELFCCNCTLSDVCTTDSHGYNQTCTEQYQMPCSDYAPIHDTLNYLYIIPTCFFALLVVMVGLYKPLWGGKGYLDAIKVPYVYTLYCIFAFIIKALFCVILYASEGCDISSLQTIFIYVVLMVLFKTAPTKTVEKNTPSGWLHCLIQTEMVITVGYVIVTHAFIHEPWVHRQATPVIMAVIFFAEFVFWGYFIRHRPTDYLASDHKNEQANANARSISFLIISLGALGLFGLVLAAWILSVAARAVHLITVYCFVGFLIYWQFVSWMIKTSSGVNSGISAEDRRRSQRTFKLFLNFSLWTLFLIRMSFELAYSTKYFGDFQDPCLGYCCNCTGVDANVTNTETGGWCGLNETSGLMQNCSSEYQMPCDDWEPEHDDPVFVVPAVTQTLLFLAITLYFLQPANKWFGAVRDLLTSPSSTWNKLSLPMVIGHTIQILVVKGLFFAVLMTTALCTIESILYVLLMYVLFMIILKDDLSREVLTSEALEHGMTPISSGDTSKVMSVRVDFMDLLLQADLGVTVFLTVLLAILAQKEEVAQESLQTVRLVCLCVMVFSEIVYCVSLIYGKGRCEKRDVDEQLPILKNVNYKYSDQTPR